MRVDQAFNKAGFEIVQATKLTDGIVFDVRVPLNGQIPMRWKQFLTSVLPRVEDHAEKNKPPKWTVEITKRFYSRLGVVRYLWRVSMRGNLATAQQILVGAALDALRTGNEVDEVPLVGQVSLKPDPANGRYKGSYPRSEDRDVAAQVVAAAFMPMGGVS